MAAIIYTAVTGSSPPWVVMAVGAGTILLVIWNPAAPRGPKPEISLRAPAADALPIRLEQPRPVDGPAIIEALVVQAREQIPKPIARQQRYAGQLGYAAAGNEWEDPTDEDHATFEAAVQRYQTNLAAWLGEVESALLQLSWAVVDVDVIERNPRETDAEEARVMLTFPDAFCSVADKPELRAVPEAPTFPRRPNQRIRSILDNATSTRLAVDQVRWPGSPLPVGGVSRIDLATTLDGMIFNPDEPDINVGTDGRVQAVYRAHAIRHREEHPVGSAFPVQLKCSGDHSISWTVSATNLPLPKHGEFTITATNEPVGPPITSLIELEEHLRELGMTGQQNAGS